MSKENSPFALLCDELIILPSPLSINVRSYRDLFSGLHADPVFCNTAFGEHFKPRFWADDDVIKVLQRDVDLRWNGKGMGDFALGILPKGLQELNENQDVGLPVSRPLNDDTPNIRIVDDSVALDHLSKFYGKVQWIGYVCVRDATPACVPPEAKHPPLPEWQEMIEVRYGLHPIARGGGRVTRAQAAVMEWSVQERGVRRFIAETLIANSGSAKVLQRLSFVRSESCYFGMNGTVEWEKIGV